MKKFKNIIANVLRLLFGKTPNNFKTNPLWIKYLNSHFVPIDSDVVSITSCPDNIMKLDIIIPTIGRSTIERAILSAQHEDVETNILISGSESCAGHNRNICLKKDTGSDSIVFVDDDDFLSPGYHKELDSNYDIVVLRMKQSQNIIPNPLDNTIRFGNVGINIAISSKFYKQTNVIFGMGHGEDWRFIKQLLSFKPRIKITKDIYYNAPTSAHLSKELGNV